MHLSFNLNNINTKTIFVFQIVYSDKISQTKILTPSNIQRKKYPVVRVQVTLDCLKIIIFNCIRIWFPFIVEFGCVNRQNQNNISIYNDKPQRKPNLPFDFLPTRPVMESHILNIYYNQVLTHPIAVRFPLFHPSKWWADMTYQLHSTHPSPSRVFI